jgi:ribonuclease VapC
MVIDTSAIMAAIAGEPDEARYRSAIKTADIRLLSAVTMLEAQVVLFARLGPAAVTAFRDLIDQAPIVIVPFDDILADSAFQAFRTYGKGQGHPAQLNIIDCAAYALARARGLPLLFKGGDFGRTDIIPALASE